MIRYDYETLSEAMNGLKERGYVMDLTDNIINAKDGKYSIVESYRFEGMTNPADSSVLYALESDTGEKGIIVDAYNALSDTKKTKALSKTRIRN